MKIEIAVDALVGSLMLVTQNEPDEWRIKAQLICDFAEAVSKQVAIRSGFRTDYYSRMLAGSEEDTDDSKLPDCFYTLQLSAAPSALDGLDEMWSIAHTF